jgi:hypothetical protein
MASYMEKVSSHQIMLALRQGLKSEDGGRKAVFGYRPPDPDPATDNRPQASDAQIAQGSGSAFAAARVALLEKLDSEVGAIILCHRGQANAIKGDAIRALVPSVDQRRLKQAIENLRNVARLPVAATKEPPYGYFIPVTAEETRVMHDRVMREAIRLIRLSQLFERDADLVRTLEGQLGLAIDDFRLPIEEKTEAR